MSFITGFVAGSTATFGLFAATAAVAYWQRDKVAIKLLNHTLNTMIGPMPSPDNEDR